MNLEETAIIKLWDITKDLLVPTKSAECRQTALTFYKRLIYTQYKNLTYMREQFFLVIQNHEVHEDLKHRLELLDTLTENGKDIKNLEEKVKLKANKFTQTVNNHLYFADWSFYVVLAVGYTSGQSFEALFRYAG